MPRYSLSSVRSSATSGSAYVPRRIADASERSRYCYGYETRYDARDTERRYRECERLLGRRSRGSDGEVTGRAQRTVENGEALRYIDLVLRQLRRASRDHQELVRQRHADLQHEISRRIDERVRERYHYHLRDRREDSLTFGVWSRSSASPWQSDSTLRQTRPNVTTRLLTKRRDYGGTAHSTVDILRSTGHVRNGMTTSYQEMEYIPESRDWKGETFGAWDLPEASSSNDRKTSSTVV